MTSGLPDWMRGARTQRFGGGDAPNELGGRSAPPRVGRAGPELYGAGRGDTHNPYAVGGPGPTSSTGHEPAPPGGAPSNGSASSGSGQYGPGLSGSGHSGSGHSGSGHSGSGYSAQEGAPADAAAHYVPGSPATAHLGPEGSRRPGLVALAVLLALGSVAYLVWHSATWLEPLVESLNHCSVERGMACFTDEPFQRWVYLPVLAVVLAWGFASGAATEGRQGRARGYLHLLAGIAALVIAGLVSGQ